MRKQNIFFFVAIIMITLLFVGMALPAAAAPNAQGYATNTPGADGRIIYVVVEGDTCSKVELLYGITDQQLREFNTHLDPNCSLSLGQQLVVGLVQSAAPTIAVTATITPPAITATPFTGTTEVCVLLFDDVNGDALREADELGVDGGAVSLTNLNGSYSQTLTTTSALDPDTGEPVRACFKDVPQGQYNVSMGIPDGYNPTMELRYTLNVKAGDRASIDFGAQSKTEAADAPVAPEQNTGSGRSSLLGIFGLLLLFGGAALGYFAYRANQPKSKLKDSPLTKR